MLTFLIWPELLLLSHEPQLYEPNLPAFDPLRHPSLLASLEDSRFSTL